MRTLAGAALMISAAALGVLGHPGPTASSALVFMALVGFLVIIDEL